MQTKYLMLLLLPSLALADGALVLQPQPDGSLRTLTEGTASAGGNDVLTFTQQAGKSLTIQTLSTGLGRCVDGALSLASLRLTFTLIQEGHRLPCGETVLLEAPEQSRRIAIKVENNATTRSADGWSNLGSQTRQQIGSVSFNLADGDNDVYPLYLDLSVLQTQAPTLTAAFDKQDIRLGMVGELNDVNATTQLRISKTRQAGESVLPYSLTFESAQQQDNQYRLRVSSNEIYLPYHIRVGGKDLVPGSAYHGQIPAGEATSDVLDVQFALQGKTTRGLAAGARLLDTVTAVITPGS
ncbi:hypothetical protein ACQKDS_06335 [Serratia sp. NPDC078593]|uniref:hypothetical protein n=1 Tax=unclassified Serratia (in: enterobacteria) TaxID=2647522 RepID=UPI0037D415CD